MRYRKIALCMHADEKYRRLTPCQPCGQALWWHMIAGPQTDVIPGLFSIGEAGFAELLDWPLEAFREAFREVFREGLAKADWKARLVWVPNAVKYNAPASPNVVISWKDTWHELPECELKVEAYQGLKAFVEGLGEGYAKALAKAFAKGFGESGTGTGTGTGIVSPLTPQGEKLNSKQTKRRRRTHETAAEIQARYEALEAAKAKGNGAA